MGGVGRAYPNYPMKAGDQGRPIQGFERQVLRLEGCFHWVAPLGCGLLYRILGFMRRKSACVSWARRYEFCVSYFSFCETLMD